MRKPKRSTPRVATLDCTIIGDRVYGGRPTIGMYPHSIQRSLLSRAIRVPKAGNFTITVRAAQRGEYRVHNTATHRVTRHDVTDPWSASAVMFCWLPKAFVGKRVNITVTRSR